MFKNQFLLLILMLSISTFSQGIKDVNSLAGAEKFIEQNKDLKYGITYLETTRDSLKFYNEYFLRENLKKNNKIVETKFFSSMRVNYIYLDGKKLSLEKINSIRKAIVDDINKGIIFSDLSKQYTMDGSDENLGDLGWFDDGVMHLTFEKEIKKHKKGDVFFVDIPENDWFYVVQKSFDDLEKVKFYILTLMN